MLVNIFYGFLASLVTVAPVFVFGFFIAVLNRKFYHIAGKGSSAICYFTGVFGTPIHELSHASMCLLFGHKIKEMKLFQIDSTDGTLGYVRHSYNKKNFYHRIGNFFIGIAPIVVGSLFLTVLMFWMVRPMFMDFSQQARLIGGLISGETSGVDALSAFFSIFAIFFLHANNGWWWGYLALSAAIALHMNLSKSDIAGSKEGLLVFIGFLFVVCLILGLVSEAALLATTVGLLYAAIILSLILFQSLFLSGLWLMTAWIIRLPSTIYHTVKRYNRAKRIQELRQKTNESLRTREIARKGNDGDKRRNS